MKSAKQLRNKFEKKLKKLQSKCKHKETKWMEYQYAPGHSSGEVLVCLFCEKQLDFRHTLSEGILTTTADFDDSECIINSIF